MKKNDRFDKLTEQLAVYKTQLMAAGVMLVLAAGPIASAYFYVPKAGEAADTAALAAVLPESTWPADTTAAAPETTAAEEEYIPSPGELNLAHFFPEGADKSKGTESLAGQAFKALMTHDEQWMSGIYDMADASPLQMAKALGKPTANVLGKYNYKDELHDIKNPDTWTINSFKKVRMSFTDGDGQPGSAYSNVIDIMSMANLYTYFKGVEDYDLFLSYSRELWERSHSYTVGISDIYYCEGCLDEDAERREYEELEAEARAEEAGYLNSGEAETAANEQADRGAAVSEDSAGETVSAVIIAGTTKKEPEETTAAPEPETESVPESTSGVIVAGQPAAAALAKESGTDIVSAIASAASEAGASAQSGAQPIAAAEASVSASVPETETPDAGGLAAESTSGEDLSDHATPADAKVSDGRAAVKCPGHIDLIVNVKVVGLKEKNGLFKRDAIGNDDKNLEEGGWPGWNNYTMASARLLSSQDWFEKYGLSLSVISMMNPLTEAEIDAYMNQLPDGISQTRKDLIYFALSSVGKVPYYWGGKPSSPNYSGNSFGIMTAPDYKGRILKGLDCSGWINWVYWSVTGKRLPYESTSGLAISGSRISRSELQPGDIIVRTGSDAHVIMFLGWTADGKIRCIHESSAGVNNVTVAIRDAYWPYYRRLTD